LFQKGLDAINYPPGSVTIPKWGNHSTLPFASNDLFDNLIGAIEVIAQELVGS
jgi:hypothetical protein